MKLGKLFILALLCIGIQTQAQYSSNVLTYSFNGLSGTARTIAIGGASTSIGGDIESISSNPAGMAFYRKSDFSISPTIRSASSESYFYGSRTDDQKVKFTIPNIGIVFASPLQNYTGQDENTSWSSVAFGIGLNQINNFNESFSFTGKNPYSSISRHFADLANMSKAGPRDTVPYDSPEGMAYDAYIINYDTSQHAYYGAAKNNVTQSGITNIAGNQTQFNISAAASYANKLYLGANVGISGISYSYNNKYYESGIVDPEFHLNTLNMTENLAVTGTGVYLKGGLIYRPADFIRLGFTAQSPTWYSMSEESNLSLGSTFTTGSGKSVDPLYSNFDYTVTTPARYSGGISLFYKKIGFISADVERVNYGAARFKSDYSFDFDHNVQTNIQNNFKSTLNYHLGAEGRIGPFSVRSGFAFYEDPLNYNQNIDRSRTTTSFGLGYKQGDFHIDFTFANTYYNSLNGLYSYNEYLSNNTVIVHEVNTVIKHDINTFMVSIGTKF